jgi:glutamate racemase
MDMTKGPIGIFDSGLGGLTVFNDIRKRLPEYDYLYLGDTARTPYGTRSFEIIYRYTLQGVRSLFDAGCPLVILACNTASAKALRSIQQRDLPDTYPGRRVLGVIRPSVEAVGTLSRSGKIGLFGTEGTVRSGSYEMEFKKLFPGVELVQEACPMWVPLVEHREVETPAAEYFVRRHAEALLQREARIDTVILACTHYPLLLPLIRSRLPEHIRIIDQGPIVAESLADYLMRHPEIEENCTKKGKRRFLTTGDAEHFQIQAGAFFAEALRAEHIEIP